ncbi:MAG TPA: acetyl-CoA C-acyltransferase, partial [Actinomycetota bacterium]
MRDVFVVDAVRTPMGRHRGALAEVRPDDLAAHVIRAIVARNRVTAERVDDVMWGAANQAGEDNRNVARMAALLAGLPVEVPGATVNRLCGSGLEAVNAGYRLIRVDEAEIVIAGGSESMTRAPFVMGKPAQAFDRNVEIYDTSIGWRFVNPRLDAMYGSDSMGVTVEIVGESHGISREAQDAFALESHRRAVAARDEGRFKDEIVPVEIARKGHSDPVVVDADEPPRPDTSMERLARLKPAFKGDGTVTAGNSSSLNDGAAAILLASQNEVEGNGWRPLARIVTSAVAGVEPRMMGVGPVHATNKALERAGLTVDDIDLVELNEAFACQAIAVMRELGMDDERTNVNGGAVA